MKITFLGTGTSQGIPVPMCECRVCQSQDPKDNRLRTSVYIQTEDSCIIIDTGPDFRQQILREKICRIDGIVFTHAHNDHIGGLDDIRCFNFKYRKPISIYADIPVEKRLREVYSYIFAKDYPGAPEVTVHGISLEPFLVKQLQIQPIQVYHGKLKILGFRIGKLTYITDASEIPATEWPKIEGSEVIILNALRKKLHPTHFHLEKALEMIEQFRPSRAYLIHMSHSMGLHEQVNTELPPNICLAYDGLQIEI